MHVFVRREEVGDAVEEALRRLEVARAAVLVQVAQVYQEVAEFLRGILLRGSMNCCALSLAGSPMLAAFQTGTGNGGAGYGRAPSRSPRTALRRNAFDARLLRCEYE